MEKADFPFPICFFREGWELPPIFTLKERGHIPLNIFQYRPALHRRRLPLSSRRPPRKASSFEGEHLFIKLRDIESFLRFPRIQRNSWGKREERVTAADFATTVTPREKLASLMRRVCTLFLSTQPLYYHLVIIRRGSPLDPRIKRRRRPMYTLAVRRKRLRETGMGGTRRFYAGL